MATYFLVMKEQPDLVGAVVMSSLVEINILVTYHVLDKT